MSRLNLIANWTFSTKRAAALGWECTYRGLGKYARWENSNGWWLEHCGHPTALWPWALYNPQGQLVLAPNRHAFKTLPDAMQFVAEQER